MKHFSRTEKSLTRILQHLLFAVAFVCLGLGCDTGPADDNRWGQLTELEAIPYGQLGGGKLVFQRYERIGDQVAFSGLVVVNLTSGESWTITDYVFRSPQVSPDGERIAFEQEIPIYTTSGVDIHSIGIRGGFAEGVLGASGANDHNFGWNQDGTHLYFFSGMHSSQAGQCWGLYDVDLQSGLLTNMYCNKPFSISTHEARGHPNAFDQQLLFSGSYQPAVTRDGWKGIHVFNTSTHLVEATILTDDSETEYLSPAWSPDGKRISSIASSPNGLRLIVVQYETLETVVDFQISAQPNSYFRTIGVEPRVSTAWSPDGTWIAYHLYDDSAEESHIFAYNIPNKELLQVTSKPGVSDTNVSWSRE